MYSGGEIAGGEAVGRWGQGDQRLDDVAHPCLVEVDATNEGRADVCGERELLEHFVSDEALIDAAQSIGKPFEDGF
jgi:hypothetical protein